MARILTDLADVCRTAGLRTIEVLGWQTRGRGGTGGHATDGYVNGAPTHVMAHHTASNWSAAQDVAYIATGHQYAPVSNLYLARNGDVYVIAAMASNTNGAGGPVDGCPKDQMNSHAIGIEAGNNGVGEPWPQVQQDAYVTLCAALCDAYAIPAARVLAHFEWAPTRKIDPAGPSKWARVTDQYQRWDMDAFRVDVTAAMTPPPPLEEVDDMLVIRIDGYADQFLCVPIDNPDARRKMDIPDSHAPVVVQADAAKVEAQIPYRLTPS